MSADEAKAYGLIDAVLTPTKAGGREWGPQSLTDDGVSSSIGIVTWAIGA